jgi:hypothetical protein
MTVWLFDCDAERGKSLETSIRSLDFDAVHREHVWDIRELAAHPKPDFEDAKKLFWGLVSDDVVLIHANNDFQHYWRDFIEQRCNDVYVVMYSGGGLAKQKQTNPRHFAYPEVVGTNIDVPWHLKEFLEACARKDSGPFDILLGLDPNLNAAVTILEAFLPLDIELQLGSVSECREKAEALIKQRSELQQILVNMIQRSGERLAVTGEKFAEVSEQSCARCLEKLMSFAERVQEGGVSLDEVFGFQVDSQGKKVLDGEGKPILPLQEEGFHRTYEKLRDCLLGTDD